MSDTQDILDGVRDWVLDVLDITSGYSYVPATKPLALPDVVVDLTDKSITRQDAKFPMRHLQQGWLRIWDVTASIMVDNSDPEAAAETLNTYADQLEASLMGDGSLGSRVPFVSPYFTFDFSAPFVQYHDGTKGREMSVGLSVGELVEAPE